MIRRIVVAVALLSLSVASLRAQGREVHILSVQATPVGALPPIALPMPASRNHHYWGFRLQSGRRTGSGGVNLNAVALGVDLQYKGGSTFGLTAGRQSGECRSERDCNTHALFGARTRVNLFTAGPTIASVIGDATATSTVGAELGFGWAPRILPGLSACTVDMGMPFSIAMLERVRLVTYVTPGIVWDVDCSDEGAPSRASFLTGMGFGLQQLAHRGFDVYVGVQKVFLGQTGYQFGISATYVLLPWGR